MEEKVNISTAAYFKQDKAACFVKAVNYSHKLLRALAPMSIGLNKAVVICQ